MQRRSNPKPGSMPQPYMTPLLESIGRSAAGAIGFSLLSDLPPILFLEKEKTWVLTRHNDVKALLKDERFKNQPECPPLKKSPKHLKNLLEGRCAHSNKQWAHNTATEASFINSIRTASETAARRKLDNIATHKSLDSAFQYAYGVSNRAIAELFSIPDKHLSILIKFSRAYIDIKTRSSDLSDDEIFHMYENLTIGAELINANTHGIGTSPTKKHEPGNTLDLLCSLLLGGLDLAIQLIAGGIQLCFRYQSEKNKIMEDNLWNLLPIEIYRHLSPADLINPKIASKSLSMNGHRFEKGASIYPFIASANRDSSVFEHPEKFDIHRNLNNVIFYDHEDNPIGRSFAFTVTEIALHRYLSRETSTPSNQGQ